jgi:hypothetical protein
MNPANRNTHYVPCLYWVNMNFRKPSRSTHGCEEPCPPLPRGTRDCARAAARPAIIQAAAEARAESGECKISRTVLVEGETRGWQENCRPQPHPSPPLTRQPLPPPHPSVLVTTPVVRLSRPPGQSGMPARSSQLALARTPHSGIGGIRRSPCRNIDIRKNTELRKARGKQETAVGKRTADHKLID